jgi:DNA-cytosine methyltransferase
MSDLFMPLTVGDLFCGAGGFSEGFRQAGFDIKWAVDNWIPAALTYEKNLGHKVITDDILQLDLKKLSNVDVIIGSPPCQGFSFANRAGNGDKSKGLELVNKYFEIIEKKKPQYWIMENVPNTKKYLPITIKNNEISIDNYNIKVNKLEILNSANYGVPQKRKRLFFGYYPAPLAQYTEDDQSKMMEKGRKWKSMKDVLERLPHPLEKKPHANITDPNYGFEIPESKLSEQKYITYFTNDQVFETRKSKVDHSYWGKMSFPDKIDKPSRTITASLYAPGRQSIVIKDSRKLLTNFRGPTIREMACYQSFPISYQFWGDKISDRIRLVGNAVPPLVAYELARSIIVDTGNTLQANPILPNLDFELPESLSKDAMSYIIRTKRMPKNRLFRNHLPNSISSHSMYRACRVDIDNRGKNPSIYPLFTSNFSDGDNLRHHPTEWRAVLYTGYSKTTQKVKIDLKKALQLFNSGIIQNVVSLSKATKFVEKLPSLVNRIPDATTLQAIRSRWTNNNKMTPYSMMEDIAKIVDNSFPIKDYPWSCRLIAPEIVDISPKMGIPIRTAAQLVICSWTAQIINTSDIWLSKNKKKAYLPNERLILPKNPSFDKNYVLSLYKEIDKNR